MVALRRLAKMAPPMAALALVVILNLLILVPLVRATLAPAAQAKMLQHQVILLSGAVRLAVLYPLRALRGRAVCLFLAVLQVGAAAVWMLAIVIKPLVQVVLKVGALAVVELRGLAMAVQAVQVQLALTFLAKAVVVEPTDTTKLVA